MANKKMSSPLKIFASVVLLALAFFLTILSISKQGQKNTYSTRAEGQCLTFKVHFQANNFPPGLGAGQGVYIGCTGGSTGLCPNGDQKLLTSSGDNYELNGCDCSTNAGHCITVNIQNMPGCRIDSAPLTCGVNGEEPISTIVASCPIQPSPTPTNTPTPTVGPTITPNPSYSCTGSGSNNPCGCSGSGCHNDGGSGTDYRCCHRTCQNHACITVQGENQQNTCTDGQACDYVDGPCVDGNACNCGGAGAGSCSQCGGKWCNGGACKCNTNPPPPPPAGHYCPAFTLYSTPDNGATWTAQARGVDPGQTLQSYKWTPGQKLRFKSRGICVSCGAPTNIEFSYHYSTPTQGVTFLCDSNPDGEHKCNGDFTINIARGEYLNELNSNLATSRIGNLPEFTIYASASYDHAGTDYCPIRVYSQEAPTPTTAATPTPIPPPHATLTGPTNTCYTSNSTFSATATKGAGSPGLSSEIFISTIDNKIPPGCTAAEQVPIGGGLGWCRVKQSLTSPYQFTYTQTVPGDYYAVVNAYNNPNYAAVGGQSCSGSPFYTNYGPNSYLRCGTGTAPNANDSVKFTVSNLGNCAPTPTPTLTPTVTPTPVPNGCGYTPCNSTTQPCQSGLQCVQANNGQYYCSMPNYVTACKTNPGTSACCNAPTATPTPTPTNTPTPTSIPTPTPTISLGCGTTCNPSLNNCAQGHTCVQANNGQYYCALPAYVTYCQMNPSQATCCTAPTGTPRPTPTPTEILIAQVSNTPTPSRAPVPTIPSAGNTPPWIIIAAPIALLLLGLVF